MHRFLTIFLLAGGLLRASEHRGTVSFNGLAVPGATVTATRGGERVSTITDAQGAYRLELAEGAWQLEIALQLFEPRKAAITVAAGAEPAAWTLEPSPVAAPAASGFQRTAVTATAAPAKAAKPAAEVPAEVARQAADGLLVNGSINDGASSLFARLPAFGNNRRHQNALYNGNAGFILNNSALDARSYSLTGQDTPKPTYNRMQGLFSFGGPIRIPRLLARNGPTFTINYQWTRNTDASTRSGLLPTAAERLGDLSSSPRAALDAGTGVPFAGNVIPVSRLNKQALALLPLFPLPNAVSSRYNYQLPLTSHLHQDDLQARLNKQVKRNFYSGQFAWQSARTDTPDLFSFLDTGRTNAFNLSASYRRTFSPRAFSTVTFQLSRQSVRLTPYFAARRNVAAEAGIQGGSRAAQDWGPPALLFSGGLSSLASAQSSFDRNQTAAWLYDGFLARGKHYLQYGGAHRRQQFNALGQQDAHGSFSFTGAAAGTDLAGFLQGAADAASIAYGNADKYLRANVVEAYLNDDWRLQPGFTVNAGLRWDSWSPATEKYGRLVNPRLTDGFTSATPSVAGRDGNGAFPQRDWSRVSPRLAFSWRPLAASSLVIRGGYGIYIDTSVFQPLAQRMAQQAPLSKNLRVSATPAQPLLLATALNSASLLSPTFAVDPAFRAGYSQNWLASVQRDLPWGLQTVVNYEGSRGSRGQRQILPNTVAPGAAVVCSSCPTGFTYLTSLGHSVRNAARFQLRRRLRSGFTSSFEYTLAKSNDDAASGGRNQAAAVTAQNWLDPGAEWARSSFDQRHLITASAQYTTGVGARGGFLTTGWRATWLREWTLGSQLSAGSGLAFTPVYPVALSGVTGTVRPDATGADPYAAPAGLFLNPAAFAAPKSGAWGNAGRNSLTGPRQFALSASLGRTFRSGERVSLDFRLDARNALNNVTYPSWNTTFGSAQFGLPMTANPMRSIQATVRARF